MLPLIPVLIVGIIMRRRGASWPRTLLALVATYLLTVAVLFASGFVL